MEKKYLFSDMEYSQNLFSSDDMEVRVLLPWRPTKYTVVPIPDIGLYLSVSRALDCYPKCASPLKEVPEVDEMVVGEFNKEYHRARVTKIREDECCVDFVDFDEKKVWKYFDELFPITEELVNLPLRAFGVTLHLIQENTWDFMFLRDMKIKIRVGWIKKGEIFGKLVYPKEEEIPKFIQEQKNVTPELVEKCIRKVKEGEREEKRRRRIDIMVQRYRKEDEDDENEKDMNRKEIVLLDMQREEKKREKKWDENASVAPVEPDQVFHMDFPLTDQISDKKE